MRMRMPSHPIVGVTPFPQENDTFLDARFSPSSLRLLFSFSFYFVESSPKAFVKPFFTPGKMGAGLQLRGKALECKWYLGNWHDFSFQLEKALFCFVHFHDHKGGAKSHCSNKQAHYLEDAHSLLTQEEDEENSQRRPKTYSNWMQSPSSPNRAFNKYCDSWLLHKTIVCSMALERMIGTKYSASAVTL